MSVHCKTPKNKPTSSKLQHNTDVLVRIKDVEHTDNIWVFQCLENKSVKVEGMVCEISRSPLKR